MYICVWEYIFVDRSAVTMLVEYDRTAKLVLWITLMESRQCIYSVGKAPRAFELSRNTGGGRKNSVALQALKVFSLGAWERVDSVEYTDDGGL
jgi:hypothetical protein